MDEKITPSNTSQEGKSFIGEIARVGAIFALTSAVVNKTKIKNSGLGSLVAIGASALIALNTNGSSNEENSDYQTIGAMVAMGAGLGLRNKVLATKGAEIISAMKTVDNFIGKTRGEILETQQKFSEFRKDFGLKSIFNSDPQNEATVRSAFGEVFDSSVNSKAYNDYLKNDNADVYKQLYYANNKVTGIDNSDYIVKRIQADDSNGLYSMFNQSLKAYDKTGTTNFNLNYLFNDKNVFGVLKSVLSTQDEAGKTYKNLLKDSYSGNNPTPTIENFLDNTQKSRNKTLLFDRFVDAFKENKSAVETNKNGEVTLSDLLASNDRDKILEKASSFFGIESDRIEDLFGNVVIDGFKKNKSGVIYDSKALELKNAAFDILNTVDKSIRPFFAFLPGEQTRNFSLLPMNLKGFLDNRNSYNFQILATPKNYNNLASEIDYFRNTILKDGDELASTRDNFTGDWDAKKVELLNKLDVLDSTSSYNSKTKSIDGTEILYPGISEKMKDSPVTLKFSYDKEGQIKGFKVKQTDVTGFLDRGDLFYLNKDGDWFKEAGKFNLNNHQILKDNQARAMGKFVSNEYSDVGINEDKYYENNILERTKEVAGGVLTRAKVKFSNPGSTKNDIFNSELDNFFYSIKKQKESFEKAGNTAKLNAFDEAETSAFSAFHISTQQQYGFYDSRTWKNSTVGSFEHSLKENLVRKLLSSGAIDDLSSIENNHFFNKHYLDETFHKSVFSAKAPTISRRFGSLAEETNAGIVSKVNGKFIVPEFNAGNKSLLNDLFIKDSIGTTQGAFLSDFVQRFQNSLNIIGLNNRGFEKLGEAVIKGGNKVNNDAIKRVGSFLKSSFYIDPNKDTFNAAHHFGQLMLKRILPTLGLVYGAKAIEGATDNLIPDSVFEGGIGGAIVGSAAAIRVGFQAMVETTGLQGAANWMVSKGFDPFISALELNKSTDEMYEEYFKGKMVPIKKNRFWFGSNRTPFSGTDTTEYRQSLIYRAQHRTSGIYDNKMERFIRDDFLPSKMLTRMMPTAFEGIDLLNPYLEEKRAFEQGAPMAKSEQLFDDIPVFGELLSATLGEIIKPTIYYDGKKNSILNGVRGVEKGFEDLKTMGGYQGYFISAASRFLFNDSKMTNYLSKTFDIDTRESESIDKVTSFTSNFYDVQLGGLLGITEPIRRIFTNNSVETRNPFGYEGEDWFKKAITSDYVNTPSNVDILKDYFIAPGNSYKQRNAISNYSDLDKLSILATRAPRSAEYKQSAASVQNALNGGKLSYEDAIKANRAFSMANDIKDRNDIVKEDNFVSDAKILSKKMRIDSVTDFNEFTSGGLRIKLAGLESDFNKNATGSSELVALESKNKILDFLKKSDSLNVLYNDNKRVKIDEKGEYLEVYAPTLDKFSAVTSDTYLRTMSAGTSLFGKGLELASQTIRNSGLPAPLMSLIGKRNAETQWYRESEQMPSFRSWEDPYSSFVTPIFNVAQNPIQNFFMLQSLGNMNSSFNGLDRVVDSAATSLAIAVPAASGVVSGMFGGTTPQNYKNQDSTQLYLESLKANAGMLNFNDLTSNNTWSQIKGSLTYDESLAFQDLVNTNSSAEQRKIRNEATERFGALLDLAQTKTDNYLSFNNLTTIGTQIDYSASRPSNNNISPNDYFYNLAIAKKVAGLELNTLENRKISNFSINAANLTPSISYDTLRNRYFNGIKTKTTSTIYGGNNNNNIY